MTTSSAFAIESGYSAALLARIHTNAPQGTELDVLEQSEIRCRIKVVRPDRYAKPVTIEYTLAEALAADLFEDYESRERWRRSPRDHVYWACVRRLARDIFPDICADLLEAKAVAAEPSIHDELDNVEGH
jgi:hypothetical protein